VPKADTVARIAEALGGDLKLMLEIANCLPRQILDRMVSRDESVNTGSLRRAVGRLGVDSHPTGEIDPHALALARAHGLTEAEAQHTARAILSLLGLERGRRVPIEKMIQSLYAEDHGNEG
jgi:tellurite resistance protein